MVAWFQLFAIALNLFGLAVSVWSIVRMRAARRTYLEAAKSYEDAQAQLQQIMGEFVAGRVHMEITGIAFEGDAPTLQ